MSFTACLPFSCPEVCKNGPEASMSAQHGEILQKALQRSESFLASLYDISHGFSKERQPCLQVYVTTYHEVGRNLLAGFAHNVTGTDGRASWQLAARLVRRSSEHPASLNLAVVRCIAMMHGAAENLLYHATFNIMNQNPNARMECRRKGPHTRSSVAEQSRCSLRLSQATSCCRSE